MNKFEEIEGLARNFCDMVCSRRLREEAVLKQAGDKISSLSIHGNI